MRGDADDVQRTRVSAVGLTMEARAQTFASEDPKVCAEDGVEVHGRFVWSDKSGLGGTVRARVADPSGGVLEEWTWGRRGSGERVVERVTNGCGVYSVCFGREGASRAAMIEIDYFQALHKPDAKPAPGSEKEKRERAALATRAGLKKNEMSDISAKVSGLNNWVQQMTQEVNYLRTRSERHKLTLESNARRTVRTTVIEVIVLVCVTGVQVVTVRRFFDVQTRSHERRRAQGISDFGGGFGDGFRSATKVAGPMVGAAAESVQRGVAGLMKSLGRAPRRDYAYLG